MRQFLQYLPVLLFTAITLAQSFFGTPTGVTHVNTSRSNSTTPRIGTVPFSYRNPNTNREQALKSQFFDTVIS